MNPVRNSPVGGRIAKWPARLGRASNGVKTSKKAVIFVNGDLADPSRIKKHIDKRTLIIAADGGAAHALALGITPHVVIGDFDSISAKMRRALKKRGVQLIKHPRDKVHTDSGLALTLAKERGCREILITGIRGTNTDHFLGNLFLLAKKKFVSSRITIVEGREEMIVVRKKVRIEGKKEDTISLIAHGGRARGITTKGLFYPLKNALIRAGSSRGIRNHMTGRNAEISVRSGALLIIHCFNS